MKEVVRGRMLRPIGLATLLVTAVLVTGAAGANASSLTGVLSQSPVVDVACANPANHGLVGRVLGPVEGKAGGALRCYAKALASGAGLGPAVMRGPVGYGPSQIQSAYVIKGLSAPAGSTVAIVDAFDDPAAASNLATFRSTYGLSPCTTSNGCFKKVNQSGAASPLPAGDPGWGVEISLDLDAVSSACPSCHILLVEANSASTGDLTAAENTAAAGTGVVSISNSWGGAETSSELSFDSAFNHPGKAITVSAGDSGYGVSWPAASQFVTAVGGTTLSAESNTRGWTESTWSGTGSGCSGFEPKPTWQTDAGCPKRTDNDVSADANPNTGLGVYDTYNNCGSSSLCDMLIGLGVKQGLDGWAQVGGTSLSSPLIAAVYALAGNAASVQFGSYPYAHTAALFDVTSGSNGTCSPNDYLCTAETGYDGPTGWGTPDGTGAF